MGKQNANREPDRRAAAAALRAEREAAERRAVRRTRIVILATIAIAVGIIAVIAFQTGKDTPVDANAKAPAGITVAGGGAIVGKADAPAKIDEWIDFQCPVCKVFHDQATKQIDEWVAAGKASITYHPMSFLGPESVRAANAFGCAVDQGKTQEYLDVLYKNQPPEKTGGYKQDELISWGTMVPDQDRFTSCVKDSTFGGWVTNVATASENHGVTGTPTVEVNGKRVSGSTLADMMTALTAAVEDANK